MGESLERWGREMQCKGSTSEVLVVVVWGMGRDGRGGAWKRSVPLGSWITPTLPVRCQYRSLPEHVHTLSNAYIKTNNSHTHTQKKHPPTHLTQGALTVTDLLFVLIASGMYTAKNTLIIPIIHPCTCFWAHRDTQRCLLSSSSESMWSAEDLLAGHTILLVLVSCWFWDLPLSAHHRRGPCGLTCQVTSLPLNTLSGTPVPWTVRDDWMSQCKISRLGLFLFTSYCWHQSGSTANCQVFRI